MIAPGRNSACPCGSGKRYKDCHGALAPPVDAAAGDVAVRRQMDNALAAQQGGRFAEAIDLYGAVIARQPETFDALHMMGVAHFQRGEFERARELVTSALAILPADAGARHNLQLIESALECRVIERAICRETLPRMGKRCVAPWTPADRWRWRGTTPDVIVSKADVAGLGGELERLVRWLGATAPTVWLYPEGSQLSTPSWPCRMIDPAAGAVPQHRIAVFYGAEISPALWYARAAATDVALYCDDDVPCLLVDRIPELAREGRTPLRLVFASPALASRVALDGCVVDPSDAT